MRSLPEGRDLGRAALIAGMALAVLAAASHADEATPHWSYSGATGPEHWGGESAAFALCGTGKEQSPIDIVQATSESLPAIEFAYKPVPLVITDTGHSFQVNAPAGSGGITVGGEHYDLVQFHFHRPSEEHIKGHPYAMVTHLVHKNAKGELAVVAVLMKEGADNAFLKPVFEHLPAQGTKEATVQGTSVNLTELLPAERGYYTFAGSLTTPPCSEQVRWFVLKNPVQTSAAQVALFAARYPHNARPIQPLNGRKVAQTHD